MQDAVELGYTPLVLVSLVRESAASQSTQLAWLPDTGAQGGACNTHTPAMAASMASLLGLLSNSSSYGICYYYFCIPRLYLAFDIPNELFLGYTMHMMNFIFSEMVVHRLY